MIRLKVTPMFLPDGVKIKLDWVNVVNEQIGDIAGSEEFVISRSREGSSYISKVAIEQATEMGGTFWIDEAGARHFITVIDPGLMGLLGTEG